MRVQKAAQLIKYAVKHRILLIVAITPLIAGFIYLIFHSSADASWSGGYWEVWLASQFEMKLQHAHIIVFWLRKCIHFTGYGFFTLLLWLYFFLWRIPGPQWFGLACTAMVAGYDEYLQSQVLFRSGKSGDVLLDICGAVIMVSWVYIMIKKEKEI